MRKAVGILAVILLATLPLMAEGIEATDRPADADVQPVELFFFNGDQINTVRYLYPMVALQGYQIPDLPLGCNSWVRMDTGQVVNAGDKFDAGSYVIRAYTTAPTPWGPQEETETPTEIPWGVIATVMSSAALIGVAYIIVRMRK